MEDEEWEEYGGLKKTEVEDESPGDDVEDVMNCDGKELIDTTGMLPPIDAACVCE